MLSADATAGGDGTPQIPVRHLSGGVVLTRPAMPTAATPRDSRVLTRLAYFVSDLTVTRADGTTLAARDRFQCIDALDGRSALQVAGALPTERVKAVSFFIGVPAKENNSDGTEWPAGHALNPLENNLRWDWKRGYVFFAAEGRYVPPSGPAEAFVYHVGNDENLTSVTVNFDPPVALKDATLDFQVDALWSDLSRREAGGVTHSAKDDSLATKVRKNVANAFRAAERTR